MGRAGQVVVMMVRAALEAELAEVEAQVVSLLG